MSQTAPRNAAVEYPRQGEMAFVDLGEPPAPGPDEVLLRTIHSGVTNGTERHALMAEHGWRTFPGRHGYQHVARVEAVGDRVRFLAPGDTVFYGQYVGHRAWHLVDVGGERYGAPTHLIAKLPPTLEPWTCALLGVAGVGMRAVRRCRVGVADRVWVAGLGPIGQWAAQSARAAGAHVTVSDLDDRRLAVAAELGAHRTVNAGAEGAPGQIKAGGPYHVIIDCSGSASILPQIHRDGLIVPRGVICLLAVRSETTFHWSMMHTLEASIEVSCHFSVDDLRVLLQLLAMGTVRVAPMVTHHVPIAQAPRIYATLRDRPGELLGVVFDWLE